MVRLTCSRKNKPMLHKMFSMRPASWQDDQQEIVFVRRQVFIIEQKILESDEWDDADANSSYVLAFSEKRDVVGTGRIEPNGKIARLAVLAEYRGQGVFGNVDPAG